MITTVLVSLALSRSLERLAMRECGAELQIVKMYKNQIGFTDYKKVSISDRQSIDEARLTILHECCHILYPKAPERIFGKPPFVNDYARDNGANEDMCESYPFYRMGLLPDGRKKDYFEFLKQKTKLEDTGQKNITMLP